MLTDALQQAFRETAVWFPLPGRTAIEVTGRDRATFLHNFCTNDIKKLPPGQGCEAFFCNAKGRVIGHGTIFADTDRLWIDAVPGAAEKLTAHLDRYLIREDVVLRDASAETVAGCLVGPKSATLIDQLSLSAGLHCLSFDVLEAPATFICGPRQNLEQFVTEAQMQGCLVDTASDWESLRIASGWPVYGVDISEENLPQEVARNERCLSFTKGCYLGQEPIARLDALGHTNRELRRLRLETSDVPNRGTSLHDSTTGDMVGQVTSAATAPFSTGVVALGYLKTRWTQPGTIVHVGTSTPPVTACVVEM